MTRPRKFSRRTEPATLGDAKIPSAAGKAPSDSSFPMRLNRYLAHCGVCARRKADQYIAEGHVQLNGHKETRMGAQVQADDQVFFKGQLLQISPYVYLLLNKPKACVTTHSDPEGRRTVFSLLGEAGQGLSAVGRLDNASTGLLLLTNDGTLAQQLSHPSGNLSKVYSIGLDKPLHSADLVQLQQGIHLEDGLLRPDKVAFSSETPSRVTVMLHSGRNRVLRRAFEQLGYAVRSLDRVAYGPLTKKYLPRGRWRALQLAELRALRHLTRAAYGAA